MTHVAHDLVVELLRSNRTMVLATADPEPWTAPVYYIYMRRRFYFFSSPRSRHITALEKVALCGASIYRDSDDWRDIEGVQMDGRVQQLDVGDEADEVFEAYVAKFPTVKDFFGDASFDLPSFLDRFRTQLYALVPRKVFYLNNRTGMGKRQEIDMRDPPGPG